MTRKEIVDQIERTGMPTSVTREERPGGKKGEFVLAKKPIAIAFRAAVQS